MCWVSISTTLYWTNGIILILTVDKSFRNTCLVHENTMIYVIVNKSWEMPNDYKLY